MCNLVRAGVVALLAAIVATPASSQGATLAVNKRHQQSSSLLDRPARLRVENVPLHQSLRELSNQSGVPLAYSATLMSADRQVTCDCDAISVREALDRLLTGTTFRYVEFSGQILIEPLAAVGSRRMPAPRTPNIDTDTNVAAPVPLPDSTRQAEPAPEREGVLRSVASRLGAFFERQQGRITGVVTDAQTAAPIPAAQVSVEGTSFGAQTGNDGRYVIDGISSGMYTIVARRIGYAAGREENVRVAADTAVTVNFQLGTTVLTLNEVVVTGVTDPTSARRVPFTVSRIGEADLTVPSENAVASIQGKVAGANVVTSSFPGGETQILLRTPTSIGKSTDPLIVVDGVILSNTFGNSTSDLDALDIESIEVVKGAAAASLFGSRAANGVIQIRTRRGRNLEEDVTRIGVRSEVGVNQLSNEIPRATHHHYQVNASGEYIDDDGAVVSREDREERPSSERFQDVPYRDPLFDHVNLFFEPGVFAVNSVSLARNSGATNFYVSFANHRTPGVVLESGGYTRNDVRVNLDHRLLDALNLSVSAYHARSDRQSFPTSVFSDLVQQAPDVDLSQPDPDGTPYVFRPFLDSEGEPNPLYRLYYTDDEEKRARTLASGDVRYNPSGWMSLDANVSYDRSDRLFFFYFPAGVQTDVTDYQTGAIRRDDGTNTALNASVSANFRHGWGDWNTRATVRGLLERESYEFFEANGTGLSVRGVPSLNAATSLETSDEFEDIRSTGYFLIAGVDYADKYIFDGLVRRDGSSLFGPDERWHNYFRGSAAYRMAEEPWWPFPAITEFKPRYSVGTAGGRPDFEDRYETLDFGAGGGVEKATLGNQELKPERSREQEIGLDVIAWDRVSLQLSYADVVTTDQLVAVPLFGPFGFSSQWQNAGTVEGNTLEATLQAQLLNRGDFRWTSGLVFARSRNQITEFNRSCFRTGPDNISLHCPGQSLGNMNGFQFLTDPSQLPEGIPAEEFDVNDDGLLVWVGAGNSHTDEMWGEETEFDGLEYLWGMPFTFRDSEGEGTIRPIGNSIPDYRLGFSNSINWRGFTLYGLLDAQMGGDVYNRTKQRMYQYSKHAETDQGGKADGLKKPVDYYEANDGLYTGNNINSWFVEDGSYLKLRELSLRYEVPVSALGLLSGVGVGGASLSVIGRNLLTWTDYTGFDPEVGSPIYRFDDFNYPQYRTVTASVELEF